MDFLNWRNILALLAGGILAGLVVGGYRLYKNHQREAIAQKLHLAEKLLFQNKTAEVEKMVSQIPPPAVGYVHLRLGDYYSFHKEWDKALDHFMEASKIFRNVDKPLYYFSVERSGYILYRKGEYKKSLSLLEDLPESIPNFCEVALLKAEDYAALGDYQKVQSIANRIVQSCPDANIRTTATYLLYKYKMGKAELKPARSE